MPSLKSIRKRITSVKNTQQITRAFKLVSAAKLRRAQEAATRSRPYAWGVQKALFDVLERAEVEEEDTAPHPLLQRRSPIRRVELVLLTSDRGLCGSFNSIVLRRAARFVWENADTYDEIVISTVGRKARDWARRRTDVVQGTHHEGLWGELEYVKAEAIAKDLAQQFLDRELDAAFILYNRFKSVISQDLVLEQLLPVEEPPENHYQEDVRERFTHVDFEYEPSREAVLEKLVPKYLASRVWQALLESVASEHGARMTAMDNATRNAGDMIDRLTLVANRMRQAAITKELMEIVSGAEALK